MEITSVPGEDGGTISLDIEMPNKCPHCGNGIFPKFIYAYREDQTNLSVVSLCPVCKRLFFSNHTYYYDYSNTRTRAILINILPSFQKKIQFNKEIQELSERFINVYNQAKRAEDEGLNEIAGIGYRKATEILIKDYAIHKHPDLTEDIKKAWLKKCIETYIDNSMIKELAKASVEIGNDETHYVKLYDDCDIDDMKNFLESAILLIAADLRSEKALAFNESHKKK